MKRMTRIERMRQVTAVVERQCRWYRSLNARTYAYGMTMTDVARSIGMSPSSHLTRIFRACVVAGWLVENRFQYRDNIEARAYQVTEVGSDMVRDMDRFSDIF